ncbi:ribosomal protein S6 kinase delta-1 [Contarinia nasturtii]|uniref:ribosomal protein S6 kinase delta-1 n=1 Tax=Contarinia nasturtii TaxID=265458 RepID=UPI0012D387FF|nr:ribosomal protein S6 kinase delta-1 [Contarinia nasturtii]
MSNSKSISSVDEKWIHSFAVTDVCLHPKKFTVYKITSVVFPIEIPEALTCLTVWKRFNDVKALLKFVKKRHKDERLNGIVPTLNNHTFFKRFEADVITERKLFIIRLLDFIGQHPVLYKSSVFQEFFATSQTMPNDENLQFEADDIKTASEDTVDCASKILVDPDETPIPSTSSSLNESFESSSISTPIIDSPAENSDDGYKASSENDIIITDSIKIRSSSSDQSAAILTRQYSNGEYVFRDPIDTPCVPNQRKDLSKFKVLKAFDKVMQVQDLTTKQTYIMKSIDKIFNEPEEFYLPTNFPFMVSLVAYYISDSNVYLLLEQATGGKLYDYIRSYNRHSSSSSRCKTQTTKSIPIKFKTVKSIFKSNPISIPDTPVAKVKTSDAKSSNDEEDSFSFYDLLQSYYEDVPLDNSSILKTTAFESPEAFDEAPHFNLIANDLDVNNILNCSQKLLKSVSTTLKRVQITTEPNLLCNEILSKSSNSIESLNQSHDETHEKDDVYVNIISPTLSATNRIDNYFDKFKLFEVNQLPRAIIKKWFRELIFAVKHLHANDIICYDLQSHNLLLGKNGEILLSYFYRREFNPYIFGEDMHQTSYPIVYIAPERPLTLQSDVWSIGVIFYELLTGYSFQSCHPDGILSYFDIQYPENVELDSNSKDLVEGMLQIDPVQRTKLDEIEEHPFFISI